MVNFRCIFISFSVVASVTAAILPVGTKVINAAGSQVTDAAGPFPGWEGKPIGPPFVKRDASNCDDGMSPTTRELLPLCLLSVLIVLCAQTIRVASWAS